MFFLTDNLQMCFKSEFSLKSENLGLLFTSISPNGSIKWSLMIKNAVEKPWNQFSELKAREKQTPPPPHYYWQATLQQNVPAGVRGWSCWTSSGRCGWSLQLHSLHKPQSDEWWNPQLVFNLEEKTHCGAEIWSLLSEIWWYVEHVLNWRVET